MSLSDALQYAAGFLDADGCITQNGDLGLHIIFTNNDIRPLERIRESLGLGGNLFTRRNKRADRPNHYLSIARQEEAIPLGRLLSPYLKMKQERLDNWFLRELGEVTPVSREINDHYIAGFFDGDGCVNEHKVQKWKHYRLIFINTDLPTLEMIQTYLEAGNIYARKHTKGHYGKKVVYALEINKKADVKRIARRLAPICTTDKTVGLHAASSINASNP